MVATIAFSPDEIREYAARAGLGFQFMAKEAFMFELMELFAEEEFVLKGGTAINKGHLPGHQRFSEDLDYDTDYEKREVEAFVRSLGWKIKKEFFTKHSIGFTLAYTFNETEDAVKAEVSFGLKGGHEKRKAVSDFLPVSKRAEMYTFRELNRQKEEAILERKEWKDLYDLYWMSEVNAKEFKIRDMKAFGEVLETLQVPKTANAYIPSAKRLNWEEIKERMKGYAADE
ncbi:TPA: nucleotidyl transferase AbiEii/AbiGii toxin family protein [Candidatus Micrarchaeota archaeon]|nr:nucleotidyl transferase AbiEii/AbiGii toxin family protein [Candidatus Micrarchaeota archaeon]HIH29804.1 nucleotidyl transferase AbiEii/AbiGii toxin family protein [Candidatus Micrarchaeota archaeon]